MRVLKLLRKFFDGSLWCFGEVGGEEGRGGRDVSWLPPKSPPNDDRSTPIGLLFGPSPWLLLTDLTLMVRSVGLGFRGMAPAGAEAEGVPCMGYRSRQAQRNEEDTNAFDFTRA